MRKLSNTFLMTLAGAAALLAACSSSKGGSTGAGGTGGGAGGIALTPSSTGFVMDATSGIIGAWYSYGDGAGSNANTTSTDSVDSDCIKKGGFTADECSQITTPVPGQPFAPDPTNGMCTSGTAAKVLPPPGMPTGSPDYSDLFGAGIGLDFNNPGGDAGVGKMPIDLSKYTGFSFTFSGTMIPLGNKIRVNFPFAGENNGTDSPYFAANATDDHSTISTTGVNTVKWANILGPQYLLSTLTPPKFDPTMVESIQFQVFTNTGAAIPYAFCVNNLTLLTE